MPTATCCARCAHFLGLLGWVCAGWGGETPKEETQAPLSAAQIAHWIGQLGNDRYEVREEATQRLAKAVEQARPALVATLAQKDLEPEVKARITQILEPPKANLTATDAETGITVRVEPESQIVEAQLQHRTLWKAHLGMKDLKVETLEILDGKVELKPSLHVLDLRTGKLLSVGQRP